MNKAFKERHDFVVGRLNAIPGISCLPGAGTFYAFANVEGAMRALGIKDDNAFAEYLLVQAGVAVVPGSGFGAPGHMRISFACSMKTLEDAAARIRRVVDVAVAKRAVEARRQTRLNASSAFPGRRRESVPGSLLINRKFQVVSLVRGRLIRARVAAPSLTCRPGSRFPTIRASSVFPGSSVVERRTVNPLVGGSNPSRGAIEGEDSR
jgi:hypothetical protein